MPPGFYDGFDHATLAMMPQPLKDAFLEVNPDPRALQRMFDRDVARMKDFRDIPDEVIKAIQAPVLVINGDADIVLVEHALALSRLIPHARLAILPGGHGEYLGEIGSPEGPMPALTAGMIDAFLHP